MTKLMNNNVMKVILCAGFVSGTSFGMDQQGGQGQGLKNRKPKQQPRGLYQSDNDRPKQYINNQEQYIKNEEPGCRNFCVGCCFFMGYIALQASCIDARATYHEQLAGK